MTTEQLVQEAPATERRHWLPVLKGGGHGKHRVWDRLAFVESELARRVAQLRNLVTERDTAFAARDEAITRLTEEQAVRKALEEKLRKAEEALQLAVAANDANRTAVTVPRMVRVGSEGAAVAATQPIPLAELPDARAGCLDPDLCSPWGLCPPCEGGRRTAQAETVPVATVPATPPVPRYRPQTGTEDTKPMPTVLTLQGLQYGAPVVLPPATP